MKLIESKAEYIPQEEGLEGIYKQIELAGRTCYKSTDKMTDDSAKPFVERMIKSGHTAMLEHGTVYLQCRICLNEKDDTPLSKYKNNKYSKCYEFFFPSGATRGTYVTTNLRVLVENNWLDDLQYLCDPTEFHEMRYSFRLITSIGVTRELNRHRVNSIAEQSTRYCNYSKDKFGGEISFIIPSWCDFEELQIKEYETGNFKHTTSNEYAFLCSLHIAEESYMTMIADDWSPQQAREVLPLCTASEIIHTAFASDWRFFFDLRLFAKTGNPHPNMLLLAQKMKAEAETKGVWDDIMKYHSKF